MVYVIGFINSRLLGLCCFFALFFVCSSLLCSCCYGLRYCLFYCLLFCLCCFVFLCFMCLL